MLNQMERKLLLPFVLILTQVYHLYGTNSTINVTVTEYTIHLEWPPLDLNSSYTVRYGVSSNLGDVTEQGVTLPSDNNTAIVHEIPGLYPGQQYFVQVEKDGIGVFQDNITTKPLPVESLQVSSISSTSVTFNWLPSNSSIQDSYRLILIGPTNHSETVLSPDTSYRVTGLKHNSNYSVSMVTISHGEISNTSQILSINTAPLAPMNVTVVAIDTQSLNVTWEPHPQSIQDGYIVGYTYNVTGGVDNEVNVNVTCPTSDDLYCQVSMPGVPGQVYEINVYSKLGVAVSPSTRVLHSTIPLPVTDLSEVISNVTSIHLKWTLPENTDFQFRHFVLQIKSRYGEMSHQLGVTETELPLTSLITGSMYNVTIVTSTGYEISPPVEKTFYTFPAQVDSLTNDGSTDITTTSFTVTWSVNDNATFDNFIIDMSPPPTNWQSAQAIASDVVSYPFTDLIPGEAYQVSIATKLADKQSEAITETFRTLPNKPTDPKLSSVTGTEITVIWTAPAGQLDHYKLTLTTDLSDPKIVTVTGTTYTFVELNPGTHYSVKLETQSGNLFSEAINWSLTTDPAAVENLRATLVDSHSINISWDAPSNASFDGYVITVEPNNTTVTLDKNITELTYRVEELEPGQFYTISVVTVSAGVASDRLALNIVTSPLSVIELKAEAYSTGLTVSWSVQNGTSQTGFTVSYQDLPIGFVTTLPPVSYVEGQEAYVAEIPDLYPGGEYKVIVQAWQNISGETAGSSVQEVKAYTKPKPIENLSWEVLDGNTIHLDWDPPTDSRYTYYLVKHRDSLRNPSASWIINTTYSSNLTLTDRFPGEVYEIEIYTFSDVVRSDVQNLSVVVAPLPPATVSVLADQTTSSSVMLQWFYNTSATYVQSWLISYHDNTGVLQKVVSKPASGQIIEAEVTGLVSGFKYDMSVQSVVNDVFSESISIQAVTKPINNVMLSFVQKPTNSSFIINYDFQEAEHFDTLVFTLLVPRIVINKNKSDLPRQVEFSPLSSGALFNVEVHTVSGGVESETKSIQAQTLPNSATIVTSSTSRELSLSITKPVGGVDSYKITCYSPSNLIVKDVSINTSQDPTTVSATMLSPYTQYRCIVSTVLGNYEISKTVYVSTKQAAPSAVRNLLAIETAPTKVTLTWKNPEQENGIVSLYMIEYTGTKDTDRDTGSINVTYPTAQQDFNGLLAGYQYTFQVRALTVEPGTPASAIINMKTYKPTYKDGMNDTIATPKVADPKLIPADPYKIVFNFTNVFSDKFGEVIEYTVIVTEDKDSQDIINNHILPGWKVARQDRAIKAYQVIQNCSTFFDEGSTCNGQFGVRERRAVNQASYKVFEIGSETGCENRYYCNGPLKPDTTYYVTLRAYTTMDHTDTPISEPVRTAAIPVEEESSSVGGIVGGVVTAITVVIVIVVVIFIRRRGQKKSNMYRHQPGEQLANRSSLSHRKSCCPVNLAEFKQHIVYMKADSDFKYAEQFEDLKEIGRGQTCSAAEQPCNRGKNRFTNILPYDHSRVKLLPIDDEDGSDYINANYIPGFNSKREYIVSQGPLPATREDFWRMLWEQNSRNIVMLTKCIEKGREKCDQYWPNGSDAVFYGDLQVAALNETLFPDWTITEFRVSLGEQSRQIRHFHFTSWPDFGVPKKEPVLVRFVRMVREKLIKDAGPIIVHCSAGVGRSGTFVVLDRTLQHIKSHDTVDIFSSVAELRTQRVWMVQTEQQYICIHNCLLCVLEGREDEHIYDNVGHSNIAFEDDEGVDLN